jgi:hypothetical protein
MPTEMLSLCSGIGCAGWVVITAGGALDSTLASGVGGWITTSHLYDGLLSDGLLYDGLPEDDVCCSSLLLVIYVILFCNTKHYR